MTQNSNVVDITKEIATLFNSLDDANKDRALCVLQALVFAQGVVMPKSKESA